MFGNTDNNFEGSYYQLRPYTTKDYDVKGEFKWK